MSRTILGEKLTGLSVTASGTTHTPATSPGTSKLDVFPHFVGAHGDAGQPCSVDFLVPHYTTSTHNHLLGVTVVLVPVGQTEPATIADWLETTFPKGTIDTTNLGVTPASTTPPPTAAPAAPVAAAVAPAATVPTAATPVAVAPAPAPAPAAPVTAPAVAATPVAAPTTAAPASATAPSTASTAAGVPITIPIPNVPVAEYTGQVLLTYDN